MIDYSKTDSVYAETLKTGRTYMTPDGDFPSMTTILGKTSDNQVWLQKWRERVGEEEADRISKEATDRGTLVHEYAEKYSEKEAHREAYEFAYRHDDQWYRHLPNKFQTEKEADQIFDEDLDNYLTRDPIGDAGNIEVMNWELSELKKGGLYEASY